MKSGTGGGVSGVLITRLHWKAVQFLLFKAGVGSIV